MKHYLLSFLVLSLSLSGCVDGGSKKEKGDDDVQVTTDTSQTDGTTGPNDAVSVDSEGAEDAANQSDVAAPQDAVADATQVEDTSVVEDTAGLEDTTEEDTAKPLPDAGEGKDVPEIIAGCNEEEQKAAMQVNPGKLMEKCEAQCGVGKTGCIVECFADATDVSIECGACFGQTYDCIQDSCAEVCESLTDGACEKCASDNGCFALLGECVGAPDVTPPGALCSPDDIDKIDNAGAKIDKAMAQCIGECSEGDYTCIEICLADKVNISGSCSTCFGMYAACALFECGEGCSDFAGDECQTCMEKKGCKAQLQLCLDGGPGGGPGGIPTPPEDAACNGDDVQVLFGLGEKLKDLISQCWAKCADDDGPNCIAKCLQTNTDFSNECAKCQGATYQCVYDTCQMECEKDLDSEECNTCVDASGCTDTDCFGAP